jgi:hypothetical protein
MPLHRLLHLLPVINTGRVHVAIATQQLYSRYMLRIHTHTSTRTHTSTITTVLLNAEVYAVADHSPGPRRGRRKRRWDE